MKLQLALDAITLEDAVRIVKQVSSELDIVELGTPFTWTHPIETIGMFKREFPHNLILADYKIMDGGEYCAGLAYDAGADITTVSARTLDITIQGAVKAARDRGRLILADSAYPGHIFLPPELCHVLWGICGTAKRFPAEELHTADSGHDFRHIPGRQPVSVQLPDSGELCIKALPPGTGMRSPGPWPVPYD